MESIGAIQSANLSSDLGQTMPVLVAEDNPVFQSMLRSMLTKWGYDARITKNGLEAWEAMQAADAPRLAVLDWMMPHLDGVEVCRRIRAAVPAVCLVRLVVGPPVSRPHHGTGR